MKKDSGTNELIDEQALLEATEAERYGPQAESYGDYLELEEKRTVGPEERESFVKSHVGFFVSSYHHQRARTELEQFGVSWDSITPEQVTSLKSVLEHASNEEDLQSYLTDNKQFLIQHLGGGHGRYVISKPRLGAELIPDYLIAEMSSIGIEWYGVELESPLAVYFTASGQAGSLLTHAIQQIVDWRTWIQSNIAYARMPRADKGLGLIGITNDLPATILIGRRTAEIPERFNDYRRQIKTDLNIEIHTYDWLVEQSEMKIQRLGL